ncbi:alpha-ketoglutarate-dependent dioxygenase alkB homolog 3 isoform X5 [Nannospalax galili]|uniref:alpha-ketoglutarate-dependent dioxygenase alkB homolog 3 isoform X5 n=1 Tax=Nannospalax galili TaxID=1026970 RepID=UPI00111C87F0|nr:alpha-ketoglutarate-dependent dioxygenase alkB homolog 3 isoform X5 [Nannospalax galili]
MGLRKLKNHSVLELGMKSSESSEQKAFCSTWRIKDSEPECREAGLLLLRARPLLNQVVRTAPEPRVINREGVFEISLAPTGISRVCLYPGFIDLKEADWILEQLCRDIPWKQRMGIRENITYPQPRLTAWYGELPYTYSRITMEPNPHWHPVLSTLKSRLEENTGHTFNSLLCNLYRDEKDSVDWHSDDEPSLGRYPVIASLSFGATRTFEMRKKPPPEENGDYTYVERVKIPLDHGTLLIMEGATQADWQHRVPKEYHSRESRVNLTFRTIYPDPRGDLQ